MAGDWIPIRLDLDSDPAVVGIAASLNISEFQCVGMLWKLWAVVSCQTANGWLPHYRHETIDKIVGRAGFASALETVGWLHTRAGGCQIPNFERWLSNSAKRRLKEAKRKKDVRKMSACDADKNGKPLLSSPLLPSENSKGEEDTVQRESCKGYGGLGERVFPRNLPCDNPELAGPARKIVEAYERQVTAWHPRGDSIALVIALLRSVSPDRLLKAIDGYRRNCESGDIPPTKRVGPPRFFRDEWERFADAEKRRDQEISEEIRQQRERLASYCNGGTNGRNGSSSSPQ